MKKRKNVTLKLNPLALAVAIGIAQLPISADAVTTNWNLADKPLYLGNGVPANLMFLVDDSGSMDWETIVPDPANDGRVTNTQPNGTHNATDGSLVGRPAACYVKSGSTKTPVNNWAYGVQFPPDGGLCDVAVENEWRFRNHDFNPLYFDPTKHYKPWDGVDFNGTAYTDVDPTQAWDDPYTKNYSGSGYWVNLLTKLPTTKTSSGGDQHDTDTSGKGFRFYTWTDKNGNKLFEEGEQTEYALATLTDGTFPSTFYGYPSAAAVRTNFANWFSYARSRMHVARGAFGHIVNTIDNMYMGLSSLHNHSNYNTGLALIDGGKNLANRTALTKNIYRIIAGSGTPLRSAMLETDKYLANQTNSTGLGKKTPLTKEQGGECQQNFLLVMTDGFYNEGNAYNDSKIGNADGDKNSYWDGGTDKTVNQAYADTYSRTLADIAMAYYESDIDTTNANHVPVQKGVDENTAQHVVTFAVAFGINGNLTADPTDNNKAFTWFPSSPPSSWPDNTSGTYDKLKLDDLRHAAYNGRGEFMTAQDPDSLIEALNHMISAIQARTSASAGLSFNSTTVRSNTLVFQGRYLTTDWTGELRYLPVLASGSIGASIASTALKLEDKAVTPSSRVIITSDPDTGKAVPFRWASFTSGGTWQLKLGASRILDYLRGDHTCEEHSTDTCTTTKDLRDRQVRLGDIVNSAPAYVGTPSAFYNFNNYAKYISDQTTRTPVVYVGSNDGMVHGFDATVTTDGKATATTGKELLAFVPRVLVDKMQALSDRSYNHSYYVDGSPTQGDVYDTTAGKWRTLLVGGLRAGGQEIYVLDVTDPTLFAESNAAQLVVKEFTDADDADLGYTFSEPTIAKLANGHFGAIFGNGYNSSATTKSDGLGGKITDTHVGTGNAVLFVMDLETGTVTKLDTGYGPSKDPSGSNYANGLSGPAVVDVDGDSIADFVYAGDLFGNVWRFDLTDKSPTNWKVSFGGTPLFAAKDPSGKMQSITTRPTIGAHPTQAGYMIYFGTGKYFEGTDYSSTGQPTQSFYGIWDKSAKGSASGSFTTLTRTNLLQQTITSETSTLRITSNNQINWSTNTGWYIDLILSGSTDNRGERVITEPILRNGFVMFTTMMPSGAVCESGGTGWLMALDSSDGSRLDVSVFDVNEDGVYNNADFYGGVAVSGAKSTHGIPSAPAVVEAAGGTVDIVLMNYTDGSLGGIDLNPAHADSSSSTPDTGVTVETDTGEKLFVAPGATAGNSLNKNDVQGRLNWRDLSH